MMWNRRGDYPKDISEEFKTYPLVTAKDLRNRRERPRQVKMMTREFIDGMNGLFFRVLHSPLLSFPFEDNRKYR